MKRICTFLFILTTASAFSQDEFASSAFYNDLKKIYVDAQAGFQKYKGDKRKTLFEDLASEYKVKLMLPLADSGKIVSPKNGNNPYAVYYFEPNKNRLKVDQRAMGLRDAIVSTYEKPLYQKSETVMINNKPNTNTWLFADPDEQRNAAALFRINIYYDGKVYYVAMEIRGKQEAGSQ
jgi:hypothetical protein